jgi:hypothetical protein
MPLAAHLAAVSIQRCQANQQLTLSASPLPNSGTLYQQRPCRLLADTEYRFLQLFEFDGREPPGFLLTDDVNYRLVPEVPAAVSLCSGNYP